MLGQKRSVAEIIACSQGTSNHVAPQRREEQATMRQRGRSRLLCAWLPLVCRMILPYDITVVATGRTGVP